MSQSQPSEDLTRQIEELRDEIAFQHVLLSSIDDNVQDREDAERDIRDEIRSLERKVRDLKRRVTTAASTFGSSQSSFQSPQAAPQSSARRNNTLSSPSGAGDDEPAGTMNGDLTQDQWQPLVSQLPGVASLGFGHPGGSLLSPSRLKLPSRKRSHSNHLDGQLAPVEDYKSRRTSQSPFGTSPPTPSTVTSGEDGFDAWQDKQNQEAARIRREKADADFARALQESLGSMSTTVASSSSSMHLPAPSGPSAFDRLSGSHQISRSSPHLSSISQRDPVHGGASNSAPHSTTFAMKRGTPTTPMPGSSAYASSNASSGFELETPASSNAFRPRVSSLSRSALKSKDSSLPMPGSYRDDSSTASDSEIEIIPASAFRANHRSSHPSGTMAHPYTLPQAKSAPLGSGNRAADMATMSSDDALQRAMYGGQPSYPWTNGPMMGTHAYPHASSKMQPNRDAPAYYTMRDIPAYPGSSMTSAGPSHMFNPLGDMIARGGNMISAFSDYLGLGEDMQEQVGYIVNDPRKNAQEIQDLLENIRPDVDIPPEDREGTPDALVYPLYEHQKIALGWLKNMETGNNKGGILADDMGLGKTISTLALIVSRPSSEPMRKTNLIVGPVALVRQWDREIRSKILSRYKLSVHMAHGAGKSLDWDELRSFDVVLTTYGKLGHEFKRLQKFRDDVKLNGGMADHNAMKKTFPFLGPKSRFYRVILDEAQCIKNKNTHAARGCCTIASLYRFCLTGTPMMNSVQELYSLIHFLQIGPYNEWAKFNSTFGMLTKADKKSKRSVVESDLKNAMTKLQALLKAILLRRTKKTEIDGKPIITLPPKTEEVQHVVFEKEEQDFYTALETQTQLQFSKYLRAGTVQKNYANVLVLLLRLRQACCHPHLIQDFEQAPAVGSDTSLEAMMEMARSLRPDVVARLLESDDVFECPVCYDSASNPKIIIPCGHDTCSECLAKITDQAIQQNVAAGNDGGSNARCPTCRGDLVKEKVIDYAAFKKVHKPDVEDPIGVEIASDDSDDDSDTGSNADNDEETEAADDADEHGNMEGSIARNNSHKIEEADKKNPANEEDGKLKFASGPSKRQSQPKDMSKGKEKDEKRKLNPKGKQPAAKKHLSIAMLKKEASKSASGRRRYMKYLRKHWQASAKTTKCVELLEKFQSEGQKTIIFSQFVSLLDLLQVPIDDKNWKCLRYDGGMSADARNHAVNKFCDSRDHNIMLISLKAGNAGLNLVAASRVIILDPFWNPYIEMQAVDRAYRIGQQRPVQVHRILVKGTVEDRIIELQENKKRLVESALDENAAKSVSRLGVAELSYLFNGR